MSGKPSNIALDSNQQRKIRTLIRVWSTKFNWKLLVDAIKDDLGITISRQSLNTYDGIKNEYDAKKAEFRGVTPDIAKRVTMSDVNKEKKIEQLEAELKIKQEDIDRQLCLVRRMLANALELPNCSVDDLLKERND